MIKTIEVCVETLEHAILAEQMGATRIELCAVLAEGGVTPSIGLIKAAVEHLNIPIHVMIRPRSGHFNYSKSEIGIMRKDILECGALGVRGVVFGCLDEQGALDVENCELLFSQCQDLHLKITFHRAIDVCTDQQSALNYLAHHAVENVLSSGGAVTAPEGLETIKQWQSEFGEKLNILAGCGIRSQHIAAFLDAGIEHIHFSSHTYQSMHDYPGFDFGKVAVFDKDRMEAMMEKLDIIK